MGLRKKAKMSDLREAIREIYLNHARRCHDPEVCIDEPIDTDKWRGCSGHTADAVLAVITAHLTVTEADADMFADVGEREGIRSVLESFVTRKLKAETI